MNKNVVLRFLLALIVVVSGLFNPTIHAKKYSKYILGEGDIRSDAVVGIRQILDRSDEKPYFIRKIYDISENQVSVTTKTYYSQYRKKPDYNKEVFNINNYYSLVNEIGSKVEFVYKNTDKDHITQINKKRKKEKSKKIAFNAYGPKSGRQRIS
jgi:hypothetical protein